MANVGHHKRGLFDFVGQIGSVLFGPAIKSNVQAIVNANFLLARHVEGVVVTQQEVLAKMNILGRQQEKIVGTLNQVIE